MRRLRAMDAAFLYSETQDAPMHAAALQIFEPAPGVDFFTSYKQALRERIPLLPHLHEHLHESPLGLDHPVWVADADVDLSRHLRLERLTPPGSMEQLCALAEELYPALLDRARPLWEFTVIEGLERGHVAVFSKAHHACLDGMAAQAAFELMFQPTPEPVALPAAAPPHEPEPGIFPLLREAFAHLWGQPARTLRAIPELARAALRLSTRAIEGRGSATPHTRFNVAVSPRRRFAVTSLSLARVRAIAKSQHVTVNEVVLAICGGALRRYLLEKHELPPEPLVAFVPVSTRAKGDTGANNQVFGMLPSLATDLADPLERLRAVHKASREAKGLVEDLRGAMPGDFAVPGAATLIPALLHLAQALHVPERAALFNVVISNVPGIGHPIYSNGARMLAEYPMSIVTHGAALNITVMGIEDALDFGLVACARAVPDLEQLRDFLFDAFLELEKAAQPHEPTRGRAAS